MENRETPILHKSRPLANKYPDKAEGLLFVPGSSGANKEIFLCGLCACGECHLFFAPLIIDGQREALLILSAEAVSHLEGQLEAPGCCRYT